MKKYSWCLKGIILATIIMCMEAAGWIAPAPWQLTLVVSMLIMLLIEWAVERYRDWIEWRSNYEDR